MTRAMSLPTAVLLALLSVLLVLVYPSDTHAQTTPPPFEPGALTCLEQFESTAQCDGDPSPSASSDIRGSFCIGYNDDCTVRDFPTNDSNFGAVVGFVPPEWTVPAGDTVPVGALTGSLTADATLGLLNGPCFSIIAVAFTLMNGSININDTIDPLPPTETDLQTPLAEDANNNGIPDGADKYPSFLNALFHDAQPVARYFGATIIQGNWIVLNFVFFAPGTVLEVGDETFPLDPALGTASVTVLQDPEGEVSPGAISDFCAPLLSRNVTFGLSRDNPCTPQPNGEAGCPGQTILANRGYPLFSCEAGNTNDEDEDGKINDGCPQEGTIAETGAQCDNDTSDDFEDSAINDGCPQFGDQSEGAFRSGDCSAGGNEASCVLRGNPSTAGTYSFTTWLNSQRDADGDGIENSLDVCVLTPSGDWNPRNIDTVEDPDNDGIPNACDPEPEIQSTASQQACKAGFVGPDEDQDCFGNRQDNCPLVNQLIDPSQPPDLVNVPVAEDTDSDGIGDACDPDPNEPNGVFASLCLNLPITIGAGASTSPGTATIINDVNCALTEQVIPTPAPTPGNGDPTTPTPVPTGGNGGGGNGVDNGPDTGIGSLSPTATSVSLWAIILAALGGVGILAGVRILRSRRIDRRD